MKKKDLYWMNKAIELAKIAYEEGEIPVGCVLVKDDEIIAQGYNKKEQETSIFSHAEINAVKEAQKKLHTYNLKGVVCYVSLEPCTMCASCLQQAKVDRIIYAAKSKKTGACGGLFDLFLIPNLNHYPLLTDLSNETEAEELLKKFFENKRENY